MTPPSNPPLTSGELFEKACEVIPGGVSSPVRAFKHVGTSPVYFSNAEGAYLYDVAGKQYIDFCMAFGPHILGHSPANVVQVIQAQAGRGLAFGACHPKEVILANLILKSYPFLQKVRLVTSGTEAVMTALRLARGFTGRDKILMFEGCYHGHSDGLLAKAGSGVAELSEASSLGIPKSLVKDTLIARYDDLESVKEAFKAHPKSIAALIVEPIPANYGLYVPKYEHIKEIVKIAKEHGTLVIFDEVISGFRVGLNGATGFFHLEPDLVTLGKVIGGGLPLAAVVGRADIMDRLAPMGSVYQAGTMAGNVMAAAVGIEVIEELFRRRPTLLRWDEQCENFAKDLESRLSRHAEVQVKSLGSIFWIHFGRATSSFPPEITPEGAKQYGEFFRRALEAGVYLAPSPYEVGFVSFAHTPEILKQAIERLEKCVLPVTK